MTTGNEVEVFHLAPILTEDALVRWVPALCRGVAIYFILAFKEHVLMLPACLAACAAAFFLIAHWHGSSLATLRADGWVFNIELSANAKGLSTLDFGNINWRFIATVLPEIGTIAMISLLSSSFSFSALELGTGMPVELDTMNFSVTAPPIS